jgi:hypothetical protein
MAGVDVKLATNNAFADIATVFYFDLKGLTFLEGGTDRTPAPAEDWRLVRVRIEGQHGMATALLELLQLAVKLHATKEVVIP